ncbi:hypothetical protein PORCRE_836 [Porphyromonas crevioricanis JCM 15906]|uniref:Uncharacterized protein n=1 Tax=Porphyromonas crevioricanis JCM 15906 TaxID=1305617 RepID=T1CH40_9PORP|nr:hypothetical protein PORCRE_836 [Porphyromonas crevioricanis JCM 15906]GAD07089.1 hypothetical protein PORCAN_706 [Porphyromonas crevioricanis JCM 13913]
MAEIDMFCKFLLAAKTEEIEGKEAVWTSEFIPLFFCS